MTTKACSRLKRKKRCSAAQNLSSAEAIAALTLSLSSIILGGSTQIRVPWNWLVHVKAVRIIDGHFIDVNPIGN